MSKITDEVLEKLKTLTLIEAAELVSQIEEVFGVSVANSYRGRGPIVSGINTSNTDIQETKVEKTTFNVILESIIGDKRVAALKVVRSLTNLGLKEAKDFCSSLPKVLKEGITKDEAETIQMELEKAGGKVIIE